MTVDDILKAAAARAEQRDLIGECANENKRAAEPWEVMAQVYDRLYSTVELRPFIQNPQTLKDKGMV